MQVLLGLAAGSFITWALIVELQNQLAARRQRDRQRRAEALNEILQARVQRPESQARRMELLDGYEVAGDLPDRAT